MLQWTKIITKTRPRFNVSAVSVQTALIPKKEQWFIEGCSQQGIMWDVSVVGKVQYDAGSHGPSFPWSVRKF